MSKAVKNAFILDLYFGVSYFFFDFPIIMLHFFSFNTVSNAATNKIVVDTEKLVVNLLQIVSDKYRVNKCIFFYIVKNIFDALDLKLKSFNENKV